MIIKLLIFFIIVGIIIYWIIKYRSRLQSPSTPTSNTSQKVYIDTSKQDVIPKVSVQVESVEPEKHKIETLINGKRLEIISPTIDERSGDVSWIGIVFEDKYYVYGYEIGKWVYSRKDVTPGPPPNESEIVHAIKDNVKYFRPKPWPETCIKTVYRNKGKKQYSLKGEVTVNNWSWDIFAYLDYDSELFSIQLSDYFCIDCNLRTNYYDFPERTKHMEKAVREWLSVEYGHYKKNVQIKG